MNQEKTGWHPIDTAPKDGTEVLLYGAYSGDTVVIGAWGGKRPPCWKDGSVYGRSVPNQPTHWMPVPDHPMKEEK